VIGDSVLDTGALIRPAEGRPPGPRIFVGVLRDRAALAGLALVASLSAAALCAPLLARHDPNVGEIRNRFAPPSAHFPLGTDNLGRDQLARLLYGGRLSILSAVVATLAISAIGVTIGLLAGYFGGLVDAVLSRIMDVLLAVPAFLLGLAVTGVLGLGLRNVIIAVVLASWARYARILRSSVLSERQKPYVEAAVASGGSTLHIVRKHLLPNVVGPIVVLTTLDLGSVLLLLSGYSFLGLGVRTPTAEWGAMLADGRLFLSRAPSMMILPGAAIFLMVLGFNLVGDGLRDQLDPRSREAVRLRRRGAR
jgi:peptide/nickel transport system permease protein